MLPLGASDAAGEITYVVSRWNWQFSPLLYCVSMMFSSLFTGVAAGFCLLEKIDISSGILLPLLTMHCTVSWWLYRTWRMLLADKAWWRAVLYALPMSILAVNCVGIWISYMQLPRYWKKFSTVHHIPNARFNWLYYPAMVLFYLMAAGWTVIFFSGNSNLLLVQSVGIISWLWFGLTLLSLFMADQIVAQMIKKQLSNLAFGALRFCADIDYDTLHSTVITLALRMRRGMFVLAVLLLTASWLTGGYFWLRALELYRANLRQQALQTHEIAAGEKDQSIFSSTSAVRQGR